VTAPRHPAKFAPLVHSHASLTGMSRYLFGGTTTGVDPGAGNIAISGTGSNPRTFALSGTDADGIIRSLITLLPGDTLVITDDPSTPPITGFARYSLLNVPVDEGGWWSFTALRTDTSGSTATPPVGTSLRLYSTLAGAGGGGGGPVLPTPQQVRSAATNNIVSTGWAALPASPVTLTLAAMPIGTPVLVTANAFLAAHTGTGDVRAGIQCSGGLTQAAGSPSGHTMYKQATSGATAFPTIEQASIAQVLFITDPALPLVVSLFALQAGGGTRQVNFAGLSASPLGGTFS